MRAVTLVAIGAALLGVLVVCIASAALLVGSRGRSIPPAWSGTATVSAVLACPQPSASADATVLAERLESLGVDGEVSVRDASHLAVTLRDVRGPEVLRRLAEPGALAMSEVLDGAIDDTAVPPEIRRETVGLTDAMGFHAADPSILAPLGRLAPPGARLVVGCMTAPGLPTDCEGAFVREPAALSNADVESAEVTFDEQTGRPNVMLRFTTGGSSRFAALTRSLVRRRLAIVVDDQLMSAPVVMEEIAGGSAQITMGGAASAEESFAEARALATALDVGRPLSCAWELAEVH